MAQQLAEVSTFEEVLTALGQLADGPASRELRAAVLRLMDGTEGAEPRAFDSLPCLRLAIDRALLSDLDADNLGWLAEPHGPYAAWCKREAMTTARQQIALAAHAEGQANADVLAGILLMDVKAVPLAHWPIDIEQETDAWVGECDAATVVHRLRGVLGGAVSETTAIPAVLGLRTAVTWLAPRLSERRRADLRAAFASGPTDVRLSTQSAAGRRRRRATRTITIPSIGPLSEPLRASILPFIQAFMHGEQAAGQTLHMDDLQSALTELAADQTVALPAHFAAPHTDQTFRSLYAAYVNKDPDATQVLAGKAEAWTQELIEAIGERGGFAPYLLGWLWGGAPLDDSVETARFYLPVHRAHAAAVWCALELDICSHFAHHPAPPMFKMGPTLQHFQRSDTCVVYAHRSVAHAVWQRLAPWAANHRHYFRETIPLFSARVRDPEGNLLPIGFGQSAPMGRSFGEYRARLVARAIRHIRRRLDTGAEMGIEQMIWLIAMHLQRGRVDLEMPAMLSGNPQATGILAMPGTELFSDILPHLSVATPTTNAADR